jgi:hypothetical protein
MIPLNLHLDPNAQVPSLVLYVLLLDLLSRLEPSSIQRRGLRVVFADSGKPTEHGLCLLEPRLLQRVRKHSPAFPSLVC